MCQFDPSKVMQRAGWNRRTTLARPAVLSRLDRRETATPARSCRPHHQPARRPRSTAHRQPARQSFAIPTVRHRAAPLKGGYVIRFRCHNRIGPANHATLPDPGHNKVVSIRGAHVQPCARCSPAHSHRRTLTGPAGRAGSVRLTGARLAARCVIASIRLQPPPGTYRAIPISDNSVVTPGGSLKVPVRHGCTPRGALLLGMKVDRRSASSKVRIRAGARDRIRTDDLTLTRRLL